MRSHQHRSHAGVSSRPELPEGRQRRSTRHVAPIVLALLTATQLSGAMQPAMAQQAVTTNGPPVQVQPMYPEPGVPMIVVSPGALNPFPGGSGTGTGGGDGTGGSGGGTVEGTSALNTMLDTSWGNAAVNNAESVGINPSALAATCVLESGCQNQIGSGAQGVFQMFPAAFNEGLDTALAANPALASQIVSGPGGLNDPTTAAIAASGYLMQATQSLENAGVSTPTVLQTRGYYNFGPSNAAALATSPGDTLMSTAMPNVSQATLANNGVRPGETVGQWQASVSAKIGGAANQTVRM